MSLQSAVGRGRWLIRHGGGRPRGGAFFVGAAGGGFGFRRRGATPVVKGTGDHGGKYMTGGTVGVLGSTGRNFAAGMSGGIAYVYDPDEEFASRCNTAQVALEPLLSAKEQQEKVDRSLWHKGETDDELLRSLIEKHHRWTGSLRARDLLDDWEEGRGLFVKVFPHEYRRALAENAAREAPLAAVNA